MFYCRLEKSFKYFISGFAVSATSACINGGANVGMLNENEKKNIEDKIEDKEFQPMFDFNRELGDSYEKEISGVDKKDIELSITKSQICEGELQIQKFDEKDFSYEKNKAISCINVDEQNEDKFAMMQSNSEQVSEEINLMIEKDYNSRTELLEKNIELGVSAVENATQSKISAINVLNEKLANGEISVSDFSDSVDQIVLNTTDSIVRFHDKTLDMRSKAFESFNQFQIKTVETKMEIVTKRNDAIRNDMLKNLQLQEKQFQIKLKAFEDASKAENRMLIDRTKASEKAHLLKIKALSEEHNFMMKKIDDELTASIKKEEEKLRIAKKSKINALDLMKIADEVEHNKQMLVEKSKQIQNKERERQAKKLIEQEAFNQATKFENEKNIQLHAIEVERKRKDIMLDEMKRKQDLALEELEKKYRLEQEKKRAELDYKAKVDQEIEDKAFRLSVLEGLENTKRIAAKAKAPSSFITSINKTISEAEKGKMDFCQIEHDPKYDNHDIAVGIDGSFNGIFAFKGSIRDKSSWTILTYGNKKRYKGNSSWGNDHLVQNMW